MKLYKTVKYMFKKLFVIICVCVFCFVFLPSLVLSWRSMHVFICLLVYLFTYLAIFILLCLWKNIFQTHFIDIFISLVYWWLFVGFNIFTLFLWKNISDTFCCFINYFFQLTFICLFTYLFIPPPSHTTKQPT